MISSEQAERIISLLEQIRDTTAANAIIVEAMHAEAIRPRLERAHLEAQCKVHLEESERECERQRVASELEHAKRPRMLFGAKGIREELPSGGGE